MYFQAAQNIEQAITGGSRARRTGSTTRPPWPGGSGSPGQRCGRAIAELVDKGLLVRKRGVGTQAVHGLVTRPVALSGLFEETWAQTHGWLLTGPGRIRAPRISVLPAVLRDHVTPRDDSEDDQDAEAGTEDFRGGLVRLTADPQR